MDVAEQTQPEVVAVPYSDTVLMNAPVAVLLCPHCGNEARNADAGVVQAISGGKELPGVCNKCRGRFVARKKQEPLVVLASSVPAHVRKAMGV